MGDVHYQKWNPIFQGLICVRKLEGFANEVFFPRDHGDAQLNRSLYALMINATEVIDDVANGMYADRCQWQTAMFGHRFSVSRTSCPGQDNGSIVNVLRNWLRTHEEAQVMLASVLVVVGLWWLVRAVLTLLINLVCPLLVVILAVVCVPQLRAPLLGQNYPVLANLLRTILLKMAENIKT